MKPQTKNRIDKLLDSAKLKRTEPRRVILDALFRADKPQTADEIVAAIGRSCPNKVTVYRTLESMIGAGLVHKAFIAARTWHFEMADRCTESQCHPHFVCTDCGQMSCLPGASVPMATKTPDGFIVYRQQVRLEGLCPGCGGRAKDTACRE